MNGPGRPAGLWLGWLQVALVLTMVASLVPLFLPGVARVAFAWLVGADADGFAPEAVRHASFLHGVLGAVMFGWAAGLFLIVRGPLAAGDAHAWRVVTASLLAWFVPGTSFSLASGVWRNVALNLLFMAAFAVPLLALSGLRRDRQAPGTSRKGIDE